MDNVQTGKLIAALRKEKGLTQQQLADLLNLSNKTISKWESGMGSPDISNLPPLADALGVSVDELLRGHRRSSEAAVEPAALHVEPSKKPLTPEQKNERAIIAFAASVGAILGIIAYHYGWLG